MRIQNLKAPQETPATQMADADAAAVAVQDVGKPAAPAVSIPLAETTTLPNERSALEIAFLKARIQHLELVLETARSLMGSNHERLLRRLHEVPREMVDLSAQLRRIDPHTTW